MAEPRICECRHRDDEHSNIESGECLAGGCGCTQFSEPEIPVHLVQMRLCQLCLDGAGGECHTPGCALWINRAPDIPLHLAPSVKILPEEPLYGIQVTVFDAETGDTETHVISDDYVITCAGSAYVDHVAAYANGTHVLTVKRPGAAD